LALKVVRQQFEAMRPWIIAILTGTFRHIADEFCRRIVVGHEHEVAGFSFHFYPVLPFLWLLNFTPDPRFSDFFSPQFHESSL
jgi:hypothetical protein